MNDRQLMIVGIGVALFFLIVLIAGISSKKTKRKNEVAKAEKKRQEEERLAALYAQDTKRYTEMLENAKELVKSELLSEGDLELIQKVINERSLSPYVLGSRITDAVNKNRRRLDLIDQYGEDIAWKIINNSYWLGMTPAHLIAARGKPDKIETEVLKTKTKEIYIYGNKSSGDVFVFTNGELERFKDR